MDNCIFCKIIKKEIPASIVYEDDRVIAIRDIHPQAPVHILIIPREHIPAVKDLNAGNAGILVDIHMAAVKIAGELGLDESGFRLINNCGADAGQTVMHIHYHLLGGRTLGEKIV